MAKVCTVAKVAEAPAEAEEGHTTGMTVAARATDVTAADVAATDVTGAAEVTDATMAA